MGNRQTYMDIPNINEVLMYPTAPPNYAKPLSDTQ